MEQPTSDNLDELQQLRQRIRDLEIEIADANVCSLSLRELSAPLKVMHGFVATLLQDKKEEWYTREDRRDFFTLIEENIQRIGTLIEDATNSGSGGKGPVGFIMDWQQDVDACDLTRRVIDGLRRATEKHSFVLDCSPELIQIEIDPEKLKFVLHWLLNNAIKYSPEGGQISTIIRLEALMGKDFVLFEVKSPDMWLDIAQQIGQTRGTTRGKIPLYSMVRRIEWQLPQLLVETFHGIIWFAKSGSGQETNYFIRLPVKQPEL